MRRLYPGPCATLEVDAVYADLTWTAHREPSGDGPLCGQPAHGDRPAVALNMVSSADGRATVNGTGRGIGSSVDRALMMALRATADALLYGAGTLRADPVGRGVPATLIPRRIARGLAPQPLLAVLTGSGDVPLERALFADRERAVVFVARATPPEAVSRLETRATVHVAGEAYPDPAAALRLLRRAYGVRHVLCEGGPTLTHALLTAGLLDDLFLTIAPSLMAGDGLPLVAGSPLTPPVPLILRSLYEHDGELYLHYGVGQGRDPDEAGEGV